MVAVAAAAHPDTTEAVANVMAAASSERAAVRLRGAGTRSGWGGRSRRTDLVLELGRLTGVVEHVAGDLVATVRAGTPLAELQAVLAGAGQRLSLDPPPAPGADGPGTVGGVVACGVAGPLRHLHGTARDLLIGVTAVLADGSVVHGGGKVVKNVAGYDLPRLLAGSWGTLAAITEATFRLHPLPGATAWAAAPLAALREVAASQAVPAAVEVDRPAGGPAALVAMVEGSPAGAAARAAALPGAEVLDGPPAWWGRLPWEPGGTGLRCTARPAGVADLLDHAARLGDRLGVPLALRGSAGAGALHAGAPPSADPEAVGRLVGELRAAAGRWDGQVVVLDAPGAVRDRVDVWGPAGGLELMRRVKERFDPDGVLAAGSFVGGI